jgi:hypothetical protein
MWSAPRLYSDSRELSDRFKTELIRVSYELRVNNIGEKHEQGREETSRGGS